MSLDFPVSTVCWATVRTHRDRALKFNLKFLVSKVATICSLRVQLLRTRPEKGTLPENYCSLACTCRLLSLRSGLAGASPKSRRARVKHIDMSELEQSELEQSIHLEEDGYKPSRDLKWVYSEQKCHEVVESSWFQVLPRWLHHRQRYWYDPHRKGASGQLEERRWYRESGELLNHIAAPLLLPYLLGLFQMRSTSKGGREEGISRKSGKLQNTTLSQEMFQ